MSDDWFEFLSALLDADARFLVVGAHAMAVHGVPRGTQDLDVWIEASEDNVEKVLSALASFGSPLASLDVSAADLRRSNVVVQIGLPPNRIGVLTSLSGLFDFGAAWEGRVEHMVRGRLLPFIGRDALIQNKVASARRKDLADAEALGVDTKG